jgi:hypothetical protein
LIIAAFKMMSCCHELFDFFKKDKKMMKELDKKICMCIYSVIKSLFKYLVVNVDDPIFHQDNFEQFFRGSLRHFEVVFRKKKYLMGRCARILAAK